MLSYVYFGTNDLARAIGFYNATLGALGMRRVVTNDPVWDSVSAGWGTYEDDGQRELAFWIGKPLNQQPALDRHDPARGCGRCQQRPQYEDAHRVSFVPFSRTAA